MISNLLNILYPLSPSPPLPWQGVAGVALVIYISLYIFSFLFSFQISHYYGIRTRATPATLAKRKMNK